MNWYLAVLKKYAVFNGRARRKEYWYFILFNLIVSIVLYLVDLGIGNLTGFYLDPKSQTGLLQTLYSLAVLIPSIAVLVRRLHDTERSGWWVLWPIILSIIAAITLIVGTTHDMENALLMILGLLLLLVVCGIYIAIFVFTLLPSDPLPNKYGPNPTKD